MRLANHGGGCCGRKCIANFQGFPNFQTKNEYVRELKRRLHEANGQSRVRGIITEVVLTNGQIRRSPILKEALDECGFQLVFKGVNKNSGATLNVFLHHPNPIPVE